MLLNRVAFRKQIPISKKKKEEPKEEPIIEELKEEPKEEPEEEPEKKTYLSFTEWVKALGINRVAFRKQIPISDDPATGIADGGRACIGNKSHSLSASESIKNLIKPRSVQKANSYQYFEKRPTVKFDKFRSPDY